MFSLLPPTVDILLWEMAINDWHTADLGRPLVHIADLEPGQALDIGQTSNTYMSKHTTRWGGACPHHADFLKARCSAWMTGPNGWVRRCSG